MSTSNKVTKEDALAYHLHPTPGKIEITPSTKMVTQRDLSLAYSPGVAEPVLAIADHPQTAYDYTTKGNLVAVISNGTAILGLGNLGALASKPVMEGKAVLFKRFADVNSIDIELKSEDPDELIRAIELMEPSFGGINLEDIKAPECFIIESELKARMNIPVFHDDQHGTAVICAAGLINALHISGKKIEDCKVVVNGAGAAGIACLELIKAMGARSENCVLCDSKGVIYQGRTEGMNQWKTAHAIDTEMRTLDDAMDGADVFVGVSVKGAVTPEMLRSMNEYPVIFAMANPDPEITPEEAHEVRDDAIVATGRSDYPNQVNNVLCFPYLFRGALDVHARSINEDMKIATAHALAKLAREDVPDEVAAAYGRKLQFGRDYIIPTPFDPRLIYTIPPAVARSGMDSGVARRPIVDMEAYETSLRSRLDPVASVLKIVFDRARAEQARIVFAEGDDERVVRAAVAYVRGGLGEAIVVGRREEIAGFLADAGMPEAIDEITIMNAKDNPEAASAGAEFLYDRLNRRGVDMHDARALANRERHTFSALLLKQGYGDGMVTGATRKSAQIIKQLSNVFTVDPGEGVVGVTALLHKNRIVFIADTLIHEWPEAEDLADIAIQAAQVARKLGQTPRVAFASFSTFGYPVSERAGKMADAVTALDKRGVDFEYDGEMTVDVALNDDVRKTYPFCRLTGPANILVMPARHSSSISVKLMQEMAGATVIGPILTGIDSQIKLCSTNSTVSDILNMAALAACKVG